jgi:hypothetical protein
MPHRHVETNRRVAGTIRTHWNTNRVLKHPSTKQDKYVVDLKIEHLNDPVLFIFTIIFWMAFYKVRFVSTFFEKQRWINSLILDCSRVCGMVVYKVENSNVFMLLQIYWDLELKVSSKSLEFFNIHICLTPLLEKQVSWYFWRPVLTAVKIEVQILERGLVEKLAAPVI